MFNLFGTHTEREKGGGTENFTNLEANCWFFSISEHQKSIFKVGKYRLNRILMTFWMSVVYVGNSSLPTIQWL